LESTAQASFVIDGNFIERYINNVTIDDEYIAFSKKMDDLAKRIDAKYFYIMADTGVPGMFTYVYDYGAMDAYGKYALGLTVSVEEFDGGKEVLATGKPFDKARYYNAEFGELYYAYAPILNSAGEVIAFVGTDIDITPFNKDLNLYTISFLIIVIVSFIIFLVMLFLVTRYVLSVPLRTIIDIAVKFSKGDMTLEMPVWLYKRNDEIGTLSKTFRNMILVIYGLIIDIEHIMQEFRRGNIMERSDESQYQGEYHNIVHGVNKTLDLICQDFNMIPEGIAFFNLREHIQFSNKQMEHFIAIHQLNIHSGSFFEQLLTSDELRVFSSMIDQQTYEDNDLSITKDLSLLSDTRKLCHYHLSIVKTSVFLSKQNMNDNVFKDSAIIMIMTDVSALMEAKQEAELAGRAKGQFLSKMSHEIRTPLNAIIGMSHVAKQTDSKEKIRNCLHQIESSSNHLLGIINDVLDFSKIEAGKLILDIQPFDLYDSINFVVSMIQPKTNERHLTLLHETKNIQHSIITTDILRLNQILLNLLSNAAKFSYENGSILLSVEETDYADGWGTFRFSVQDFGIGIDHEHSENLFSPFVQADGSISRKFGGTGLGLSISKSFIEMMNGKLWVESEGKGKGSSFIFTLRIQCESYVPKNTQSIIEVEHIDIKQYDFSGKRVLVVDDVEINQEIIIELLDSTGIASDTASNGEDALAKFNQSPSGYYDVILMDVQMPVMDGLTATEKIRSSGHVDANNVIIIAMTANVMQDDVDNVKKVGMNDHLGKPIELDIMLEKLNNYLNQ
jgi:signal transduction histidine kinase/ActR/RegA family two-component response regulator/HAMP domain-containing protein